jgi:hypothetical protein
MSVPNDEKGISLICFHHLTYLKRYDLNSSAWSNGSFVLSCVEVKPLGMRKNSVPSARIVPPRL